MSFRKNVANFMTKCGEVRCKASIATLLCRKLVFDENPHFCTFPQNPVENGFLPEFSLSATILCRIILYFVDFSTGFENIKNVDKYVLTIDIIPPWGKIEFAKLQKDTKIDKFIGYFRP